MIKPPLKDFIKTNHHLSFLLGIVFAVLGGTVLSALIMWILEINPQDIFLQLEEMTASPISQDQQEGIDVSAINFSEQDHYLGNKDAQKIFVFYADLESSNCQLFYQNLKAFSVANPDQVKIVWRNFPLDFHPQAKAAAQAAECAAEQNVFWPYVDLLFNRRSELTYEFYLSLAQELSLDYQSFKGCLDNQETDSFIEAQFQEAVATGISGTPNMIYINQTDNTYKYIGGYVSLDYLQSLID